MDRPTVTTGAKPRIMNIERCTGNRKHTTVIAEAVYFGVPSRVSPSLYIYMTLSLSLGQQPPVPVPNPSTYRVWRVRVRLWDRHGHMYPRSKLHPALFLQITVLTESAPISFAISATGSTSLPIPLPTCRHPSGIRVTSVRSNRMVCRVFRWKNLVSSRRHSIGAYRIYK